MEKVTKQALVNSILTTSYIIIVASLMIFLGNIMPKEDSALAPVSFLMLFVFSAGLTASLVFGKPIMLYLDKKKKEALKLLKYTLFFLFIITILAFIIMILVK